MSREIPILFRAAMVRANNEGRKTETRRVMKPQPILVDGNLHWLVNKNKYSPMLNAETIPQLCPYGAPGDILWVKEHWGYHGTEWNGKRPEVTIARVRYHADEKYREIVLGTEFAKTIMPQNVPNQKSSSIEHYLERENALSKWWERKKSIPSIHMPKWACRTRLINREVGIERVQDISPFACEAEGLKFPYMGKWEDIEPYLHRIEKGQYYTPSEEMIASYAHLWNTMRAGTEYSWEKNPFVWVVKYTVETIK